MPEFEWDDHNTAHIWDEHRVTPQECEEALLDERRFIYPGSRAGERRLIAVGSADAGRLLAVVYTLRHGAVRVVTARDASAKERRRYRSRRRR